MRSAQAPIISAGVIAANFNWKAKKSTSGICGAYVAFMWSIVKPFKPASDRLPIIPLMLGLNTKL